MPLNADKTYTPIPKAYEGHTYVAMKGGDKSRIIGTCIGVKRHAGEFFESDRQPHVFDGKTFRPPIRGLTLTIQTELIERGYSILEHLNDSKRANDFADKLISCPHIRNVAVCSSSKILREL